MTKPGVRVRHSSFGNTGIAVEAVTKRYRTGEEYPGCIVQWDKPCILDSIVANYNLIFIVPSGSRKLECDK